MDAAGRGRGARIAVTSGDCNGIGPEVALKAGVAAAHGEAGRVESVVLVGPRNVWEDAMRICGWSGAPLSEVEALATPGPDARPVLLPAICTWDPAMAEEPRIRSGCVAADAALSAYAAVAGAVSAALNGHVDAIVTAPVSEEAFWRAGIRDKDQEELLARLTKTPREALSDLSDEGEAWILAGRDTPMACPATDVSWKYPCQWGLNHCKIRVKLMWGLPLVCTAPGHGPALEIAGHGVADDRPMLTALRWAAQLAWRGKQPESAAVRHQGRG